MAKTELFVRRQPGGLFAVVDEALTTGNIFFVHHSGTNAAGGGQNPDAPVATIDYAIGLCTANNGDIIYVKPGHAETISAAAGVALDVAGVSIIGLGNGALRPTLTFATSTAADFNVSAENCRVKNLRFVSNIDSLVNFLDLDAGNFVCEDCWFETSSTKEAVTFVDIATTKDFFTFRNCTFLQPTDPAGTDGGAGTGCFYFVDSEHLTFESCKFIGNFETSIWHNRTTAAKYVWIRDCYGRQELSGAEIFTQVAAMSGGIMGSLLINANGSDVTEAQVTGTLSDNFFVNRDAGFGNDGAGGQAAVAVAADAT